MVTYYYSPAKKIPLAPISEPRKGVWVIAEHATSIELDDLAINFDLNRDLLNDAADPFEAPRFETENGIAYFFMRFPTIDKNAGPELATTPVLIIVTNFALLTISHAALPFLYPLRDNPDTTTSDKAHLMLSLADSIVHNYNREILTIRKDMRRYYVDPRNVHENDIIKFVELESRLNDYSNSMEATSEALYAVKTGKAFKLGDRNGARVEDLILATDQIRDIVSTTTKSITNLREVYGVVATNRLNRVMRTLTTFTVVLTIPTIITSFFGMNVPLPFSENRFATALIIIIATISCIGLLYAFKNQKWV